MIDSLYIGATGLHAQQLQVDTVANNLVNLNTTGFKRSRVSFEDLMYREAQRATPPRDLAGPALIGAGVGVAGVHKLFGAGDLKKTDNAHDIAIRGDGFLEAVTADGQPVYTRTGRLSINKDGQLATAQGHALRPLISVPADPSSIQISASGVVSAVFGEQRASEEIGQLELALFPNPAGLQALGENTYQASDASGLPSYGEPGAEGRGPLAQGFLEASNVKLADEMVDLMGAQRAYELAARLIQVSDELMALSNNLKK